MHNIDSGADGQHVNTIGNIVLFPPTRPFEAGYVLPQHGNGDEAEQSWQMNAIHVRPRVVDAPGILVG